MKSKKRTPPTPLAPLVRGEPETSRTSGNGAVCHAPSPEKGRAGEGFLPYDRNLTALARENRSNPTKAERKMWHEILRMRQFANYKFLRQKPIAGYIVDFYCSELQLVIEIDGESHSESVEYDAERTKILEAVGLKVVRYSNGEVLRNIQGVYDDLSQRIDDLSQLPIT